MKISPILNVHQCLLLNLKNISSGFCNRATCLDNIFPFQTVENNELMSLFNNRNSHCQERVSITRPSMLKTVLNSSGLFFKLIQYIDSLRNLTKSKFKLKIFLLICEVLSKTYANLRLILAGFFLRKMLGGLYGPVGT